MRKILPLLVCLFALPAVAQTGAIQGFCDRGGTKATTSGSNSSNYLQGNVPSCTVTVYLTGTTTKATIYSDKLNTPLANPFTANSVGSVSPGGWIFWSALNTGYDVVLSGGISPNTYPSPVTLADVFPSSQVTIPTAGCVGQNAIANGCTGATTSQGAATNIVDGNSIKPASVLNANVNGVFSVTKYGAVGDCTNSGATTGCTNNLTAFQAAIDAAYAVGGAVYLPTNPNTPAPQQTIYYLATPLNWKGVPIYGPPGGQGNEQDYLSGMKVAIRGGVGQDMFDVLPPGATGYVAPVRAPSVENLGFIIDTSTDVSASHPTRLPGRRCDDVATNGTAVITSAVQCRFQPGDAGQNIKVGATTTTVASVQSATEATLATTVTTATGVSAYISVLDLPVTQTIGNCAFAFDDPTDVVPNGFGPLFTNVVVQASGQHFANYTCGFFFQGNAFSYFGHWTNVFVGTPFGLAFVPGNGVALSVSNWAGMGDLNTFGPMWLTTRYPFLSYNGLMNSFRDMQIFTDTYGPQILQTYGVEPAPFNWSIDLPEIEFGSCPTTPSSATGFRIAGSGHVAKRLSLSVCPGQTIQWDASASQVANFQTDNGVFNFAGNLNTFNAPEYSDLMALGTYNAIGVGNTITNGTSTNPYKNSIPDRKTFAFEGGVGNLFGPPQLSRGSVIANRSHDFLDTGASAYYFNAEDLWMWPKELAGPGSPTVVTDTASPSGNALKVATSTTFQVTTANVADLYVGSQLPAGKMRNYFFLRADSNTNFSVSAQAYESGSWTNIGCNTTFAVTTTYLVFSCDVDATGLKGDAYQIYLGSAASANVYVGYWGIRPYDSDPYGNYPAGGTVSSSGMTTNEYPVALGPQTIGDAPGNLHITNDGGYLNLGTSTNYFSLQGDSSSANYFGPLLTTEHDFAVQGQIHIGSGSSHGVNLKADNSGGRYDAILPANQGTGALTNDGAGNLSWVPGSYPGVTSDGANGIVVSGNIATTATSQAAGFIETLTTPASSSAACIPGQFTDDAGYHYVCTAANTWKRVALATF